MTSRTKHPWIRKVAATLAVVACCVIGAHAKAAEIPWPAKARFQSAAQKKDLRELLRELALGNGITVSIAEGVEGSVSGRFDLKPQAMLDLLASSHGFIWYFDGALLHVLPASAVRTEVINLRYGDIEQLRASLMRLGVFDRRFPLQDGGDGATVVISGPDRYVELVQQIADKMEGTRSRNQPTEVRVFPLQFAWAADHEFSSGGQNVVVSGVASTIRSMYQPQNSGPRSGMFANLQKILPAKHLKMSGDQSVGSLGNSSSNAVIRPSEATRGNANPDSNDPADDLPIIQADPRINAVLIRDIPSRMKQYESLIRALDVRPQMIEIEARIIEISTEEVERLGVDWRGGTQQTADAGNSLGRLNQVRNFMAGGGVLKSVLSNAGLNLVERLNALAAQGKANVTASPSVLTLNNLEARMDNLESFYVRVSGHQSAELFNISTGVTLRVTPMIVAKGNQRRIKLDVRIEDGRINDRTVDQIPVVKKSEINTQAFVNDGDALLIAGYALEQENKAEAKVPGLSGVPLFGNMFKHQESSKSKVQRMFLLTPHIVDELDGEPEPQAQAQKTLRLPLPAPAAAPVAAPSDILSVPLPPAPQPVALAQVDRSPAPRALPVPQQQAPAPAAPVATIPPSPLIVAKPIPAPPAAPPAQGWEVTAADRTLKGAMTRWAAVAGWQLMWELPVDYEVDARSRITGSFEDAVTAVSRSLANADPAMKVVFYKANKVVRIIAKEAE